MKNLPLVRQSIVSAGALCNIMGQGAALGYSSVLLAALRKPNSNIKITTNLEGWIASITGLGFIFGIPAMVVIMDKFGRRKSQIATPVPFLISWFLIALAENALNLVIARFIQGLAIGLNIPLVTVVVAEMTAPIYRGMFLVLLSLSLTVGNMLIQYVGIILSWQATAIVTASLHFISLIIFIYGPESPHWLVSTSRYHEAKEVFFYLRGNSTESQEEITNLIESQMAIKKTSEANEIMKGSCISVLKRKVIYFFTTLTKPEFYKPLLLILHSYFLSQIGGPHIIAAYTSDIIIALLGPDCNITFWIIVVHLIRLISNISLIFIYRHVKRKTILLVGCIIIILCYLVKATYIYSLQNDWISSGRWIPMTALMLFCLVNVTCMTFTTVVGGEIFPLEYRALGGGLGLIGFSVVYFLSIKTYPSLISSIGLPLTYFLYSVFIVVNLIIVISIMPETKDKSLQDIEDIFRNVKKAEVQELQSLKCADGDE